MKTDETPFWFGVLSGAFVATVVLSVYHTVKPNEPAPITVPKEDYKAKYEEEKARREYVQGLLWQEIHKGDK